MAAINRSLSEWPGHALLSRWPISLLRGLSSLSDEPRCAVRTLVFSFVSSLPYPFNLSHMCHAAHRLTMLRQRGGVDITHIMWPPLDLGIGRRSEIYWSTLHLIGAECLDVLQECLCLVRLHDISTSHSIWSLRCGGHALLGRPLYRRERKAHPTVTFFFFFFSYPYIVTIMNTCNDKCSKILRIISTHYVSLPSSCQMNHIKPLYCEITEIFLVVGAPWHVFSGSRCNAIPQCATEIFFG